ncbi:YwaF family protein [Halalkalibacter alkalisediminis]|uniref:TIGR02206 family membrane protein n=2 Tax=Halalkalibacter alkalisediminis TaxID=935616 RepID=A0ABV6NGW8_9BACI|nr:TIGR02206 family membrane protein [Halalkalibacter alkalisediminis]
MLPIFEIGTFIEQALFLSPAHIYSFLFSLTLIILLYRFRNHTFINKYSRVILISILVLTEISLIIWSVSVNQWDLRYNLPLQLCTISLYLCLFMLITKNFFVFEVVYFFGMAGALQALITPDLFYTFPHFRFLHFFIAHIAIILSILYMVWVEKFSVTFSSIFKSMLVLNGIAFIAFWTNKITGANYMFLSRKPNNPSMLDLLGPYPWYILSLEFIALFMFVLLYLPFLLKRTSKTNEKRKRRRH